MPDEPTRPEHEPPALVRGMPAEGRPGESWPGPGWPPGSWAAGGPVGEDDDDDWPDDDEAGSSWPPPAGRAGAGVGAGGRGRRPLILAVIGVVALVLGAGLTLAISSALSPSAPAAAGHRHSPLVTNPGGSTRIPGAALPGGGTAEMLVAGRVQAISPTSITLGAPGRAVTAAITSSTRVSGKVTGVSQIKVGDSASAQITQRNGKSVVTAIQDPAQLPAGGGPP